jgi:16S rRNA C967 or C1407 C5-methylase (RsmB/RsmF family)/NOL1/NOP2/fmu family ribosome biogenesis protein
LFLQSNIPPKFVSQIHQLLGAEADSFLQAIDGPSVTSVRINPFKQVDVFAEQPGVEWCPQGYYLAQRPEFIFDPLFHSGAYYVQESSSMFLYQAISQLKSGYGRPIKVLDLCAAPGGKSTLIASLLQEDDLLVSNEILKSRVGILEENLTKWGIANAIVTNNDPKTFKGLTHFFDLIVIDAPCSGEGLFRRDKAAMDEWSPDNVRLCESRQQRIVADIINCLKPGGHLVYSTCTYNQLENESNVKWMQQEWGLESVELHVEPEWPIAPAFDPSIFAYRFFPHKVKGEGLFLACLQKPYEETNERMIPYKRKGKMSKEQLETLRTWINNPDAYEFMMVGERVHAIPLSMVEPFQQLTHHLYLKNAGIFMGNFMKNELIPSHQLALCNVLSQSVQRVDVTRDDAIRYLRKDNLVLDTPLRGWTVLTFNQLPLGWVKLLPNRLNNYLPSPLRIVKEYTYAT